MMKIKTLAIEDSQIDIDILVWKLKKRSVMLDALRVETEADIKLALSKADFDLIISDRNMPGLNLITALIKCRKYAPNIPFVVFSIYVPQNVLDVLKANGVSAVFNKEEIEPLYQFILNNYFRKQ